MEFPPRVVLATDHAGYPLKEVIKAHLLEKGVDVVDKGCFSDEQTDYPPIMREGAASVLELGAPGVFFGGSGIGESIAANKVHGIRSGRCTSTEDARLCRAHNNANVMCMGGRMVEPDQAIEMVDSYLTTDFDGGRHENRVNDLED